MVPEGAELRQVGLPEQDRAGAAHPPDHLGVLGRHPVSQEARTVGRRHSRDRDYLLDRERHAVERPQRVTTGNSRIGGLRFLPRLLQPL
jgi:hypothetical protein